MDDMQAFAQIIEYADDEPKVDNDKEKYLTFYVDDQLLAIPSSQVIEILSMPIVTFMPRLPRHIKGVVNIRGKIVPLIELRAKLNIASKEYDERTCIVVIEIADLNVGFIVDQVSDVIDIGVNEISSPPKVSKDCANQFMLGIANINSRVVILINAEKILFDNSKADKALVGEKGA